MIKNSLVALCVVLFILASQQPAEAKVKPRHVLKYGVFKPAQGVGYVLAFPGSLLFYLAGFGSDTVDQMDQLDQDKADLDAVLEQLGKAHLELEATLKESEAKAKERREQYEKEEAEQ